MGNLHEHIHIMMKNNKRSALRLALECTPELAAPT